MHTRALWLLVVFLVVAMAARLYQIQTQSLWFDEGWSAYAAVQPTLQAAIAADATNPPLYYLLLNLSTHAFGDSPFALRWFSTMFGLLVVPLAYQLARRLFDVRAGIYAAFLTTFSPLLWWASQEARMYTLLATLMLVAALGWHQLLKCPARWAWLAVWGGELALLYAHNTGPVVVIWLNVVTLLAWIIQRRPDWRFWITGQVGVMLLWSPWFVTRFVLLQSANSAVTSPPEIGLTLLNRMWQALWTGAWLMVERESLVVMLSAILLLLVVGVIPWRQSAARWLVLHVGILTAALLVGLWVIGNEIHGRYLVMMTPLLLIAIGAGIARLQADLIRAFALLLVAITFLVSLHFATQNPAYGHDDARGMVQYYADNLTAQDTVLAWSYADRYELAYYWARMGVQARRVTLPEGADLDTVLPLLPTSDDVALNVWYTQRADFRGMMACVLGHGTINTPEEFTVYGMSNLLYRSPDLNLPALRSTSASFAPSGDAPRVELEAVGEFPAFTADRALCLPARIRLLSAIETDLKAAIIVYNNLGWEVARADAVFATANQRTSSQVLPDETMTAYPLIRLPYGAPGGDYTVRLRIYDEVDNVSGYNVLPIGVPAGKDLLLGTWTLLFGAEWTQVNRSADLPIAANLTINDNLTLVAHNAVPATLVNGSDLRLAFLWEGTDTLPDMTLAAAYGSWQVDIPIPRTNGSGVRLDWREVRVPPEAVSGGAELRLGDGTVLARYSVESLPALYIEPEYEISVDVAFAGVGTLVGYTLEGDSLDRSQPVPVTLVWWAQNPTPMSFTVFVQLLGEGGQVIAQSDSLPGAGGRPTTGWRPGEYIVDQHQVTFHDDAMAGMATLIVGMYNPETGERITLPDGSTAVTLAEGLQVR